MGREIRGGSSGMGGSISMGRGDYGRLDERRQGGGGSFREGKDV